MAGHCDICDTSYNTETHKCSDRKIEYIVHRECMEFDYSWENFLVSKLGRFMSYCAAKTVQNNEFSTGS
jgi:hypothetical protein